jgi:SprT protein
MDSGSIHTILTKHVPATSVGYCHSLWARYSFDFTLRKSRLTKIGDFCSQPGKSPRITINQDLEPYLFLTTYIHEIAHLEVFLHYGHRVESHGPEWKSEFQKLLGPVMVSDVFPSDLLAALHKHMANPKATMYSDSKLMRVFRKYDHRSATITFLCDIPSGSIFELRGRWFRKEETKRTRVLCQEVKTKRKYLVPADAEVRNVQLSFFELPPALAGG